MEVQVALGKASREVDQAYAKLAVARDVAAVVPTFTAAMAVVAATDFLATIPESVVQVLGPALRVRIVASPLRVRPTPMHLSWHQRTQLETAMRLFRELLAQLLR